MKNMKPAAMTRALERAANRRWAAGREERRRHIKALETQNREMVEDHDESVQGLELAQLRIQVAIVLGTLDEGQP